jgi:hypothetical protein
MNKFGVSLLRTWKSILELVGRRPIISFVIDALPLSDRVEKPLKSQQMLSWGEKFFFSPFMEPYEYGCE